MSRGALAVAAALVVAAAVVLDALVAQPDRPLVPWAAPAVLASGLGAAGLLTRRCRRRLGGVTGDVLGAAVEVSLAASLLTAALLVSV